MKLILQILLILIVVSTAVICTAKPKLHKTVMVYDSAYTIVKENDIKVETETIPVMEMPVKQEQRVQKVEQVIQKPAKTSKQIQQTKVSTQTTPQKTKVNTVKIQTPKAETVVKQTQSSKPQTQTTKVQTQKVEIPIAKQTVKQEQPKVLTQQEETIAWNIWRSNLQNQIMQDVKLPLLPNGIIFRFSFTVDKYGKISNLQTWSDVSSYTPYAIQYIAPVIRSYQGRSILNFPTGTARTITDVKGGWKISDNAKYSSPQDYNDIEKVVK